MERKIDVNASEIRIESKHVVSLPVVHNSSFLIFPNFLFKEVGLSFQGDVLHEIKWIFNVVHLEVSFTVKDLQEYLITLYLFSSKL